MAPRNPGGNSKAPPAPVAAPPPVVFPPEASAPPAYVGHLIPPQVYKGTPIHSVPDANKEGWTTGLCGCFDKSIEL
ncbi:hypothetical protein NL676_003658 [Syzygium grande]|nr:hypothetical protein NL676_003658 [Syzygium grande]